MTIHAVLSLSGGLDSTVLLADILQMFKPEEVMAVNFQYGSKHNKYELKAFQDIVSYYKVHSQLFVMDNIFSVFISALLQGGEKVPEGHYEAESMRRTVVPCRNMIFTSVLAGYAESLNAPRVYLGVHAGDHFIYPDCRADFISNMMGAVVQATEGKVNLVAPYLHTKKSGLVRKGKDMDVPFHLTRTCYKDQDRPCGKCGSCQERMESFALNHLSDPLDYESHDLLPKEK